MELKELYGLDKDIRSFAVANKFVEMTNKACYQLGKRNIPFCIYGTKKQKENGVLDFVNFDGLTGKGTKFVDEILEYRSDVYKENDIPIQNMEDEELKKRLLFFDYLLSTSICYVELEKYTTKKDGGICAYDKMLATRNPRIMSLWTGQPMGEIVTKYSSRLKYNAMDFTSGNITLIKLNSTKTKGNTLTRPRGSYSVETMRVIPLYMLTAFLTGFKENLTQCIYKVSFEKDNGTIREISTTINRGILSQVYDNGEFVDSVLQSTDIDKMEQGGMRMATNIGRGYIRVPELGASIYDNTGTRSINVARLTKIEQQNLEDVDLSYINIDLNSIIETFNNHLDYALKTIPNEMRNIYMSLTGMNPNGTDSLAILGEINDYVNKMDIVMSTVFKRRLHNFLKDNPQWFPRYMLKEFSEEELSRVNISLDGEVSPLEF